MERRRVGVVDRSPTIRETVAIVLHDCEVQGWTPEEFAGLTTAYDTDLLLVEEGVLDPAVIAAKSPGVPVLWLCSERAGSSLPPTVLSREFRPSELRQKVRTLLEVEKAELDPLTRCGFPLALLPPAAVPSLLAAARTRLPVFVSGEAGSGRFRLARALHQASEGRHFVSTRAATFDRQTAVEVQKLATSGRVTLFLEGVEELAPSAQGWVRELLEPVGVGPSHLQEEVRIISASTLSRDALEACGVLEASLFYLLTAFVVHLPPLRERREEIPRLVAAVARQVAENVSVPPASFTPAAMQRLQNYLWFGNLAELESVLARTLTLVPHRPVDAQDLVFGYGPFRKETCQSGAEARRTTENADPIHQIEVLVNELAHEVKNPLVTIKTISQHLERLWENASGREEVAQLAGEAVLRIDQVIENLLRYARFREPAKQATTINSIVGSTLTELAPFLTERRVVLNYLPPDPMPIVADREQLCFALDNLLRAIVRDLEEQDTLTIEPIPDRPALRIRVPRHGTGLTERLSSFVSDRPAAAGAVEPLGFLLARSLLRRNGGSIQVRGESEQMVVTVEFPSGNGTNRSYAQTTNPHRG